MGDCPDRVTVPIIFLPGIMGSRLKNTATGAAAWDPDSSLHAGYNYIYGSSGVGARPWGGEVNDRRTREAAAVRKGLLVGESFNSTYLSPMEFDESKDLTELQIERNWGSVYQGSYKTILSYLDAPTFRSSLQTQIKELNPKFDLVRAPVFACGYNWSASNEDSGAYAAEKIKKWVADEKAWAAENDAQCPGAILVTHSMGGFVARAACLQGGAASDVFAVLSTVMPTDGAAATYKRFHFGFENPGDTFSMAMVTYIALGREGALVTALLGHMPGAQELLPNKRYKDNAGNKKWLKVDQPERNRVGRWISGTGPYIELPEADPYKEIYRREDRMYRAANPEWLFPEASGTPNPRVSAFDYFLEQNITAEAWHEAIIGAGDFHELTYICHSSDLGHKTYDRVDWQPDLTGGGFGRSVQDRDLDTSASSPDYDNENILWGSEEDKRVDGDFLRPDFKIALASGAGDMTVPISAQFFANLPQSRKTPHPSGYEHEGAVSETVVLDWVKEKMVEVLGDCSLY